MEKTVMKVEVDGKIVRVALYIRVSTEEQAKHGLSLDAQKEALMKYAHEQGWKIVDFYIDEGITARKSLKNRKEFQRLILDVQQHKIDMIIFIKLDRWFRNVSDYYATQKILEKYNVGWIATEEDYDTTTSNGVLHLNIKLSIAQNESDQTSDRIKFVFKNKREKGEVTSGTKKFGYDIENLKTDLPKKYVINEKEQEQILDLYNYILNNGGSINATRQYNNTKYNKLSYNTIKHLLTDSAYIEKYKLYESDEIIEGYTPRIMSDELFYNVQKVLKRVVKVQRGTNELPKVLFDGMVVCASCGGNTTRKLFYDKKDKSKLLYVHHICAKARNCVYLGKDYKENCNDLKVVSQRTIEDYLMKNLKKCAEDYIAKNEIVDTIKEKQPKNNSAMIQRKMERLKDLYVDDLITMEDYKKDYEKFKKMLDENNKHFEKKVPKDLSKCKKILNMDFKSLYNSLDFAGKRQFWSNTIDKIYIQEGEIVDITFI